MSDFKIGDTVRIINPATKYMGQLAEIVGVGFECGTWDIRFLEHKLPIYTAQASDMEKHDWRGPALRESTSSKAPPKPILSIGDPVIVSIGTFWSPVGIISAIDGGHQDDFVTIQLKGDKSGFYSTTRDRLTLISRKEYDEAFDAPPIDAEKPKEEPSEEESLDAEMSPEESRIAAQQANYERLKPITDYLSSELKNAGINHAFVVEVGTFVHAVSELRGMHTLPLQALAALLVGYVEMEKQNRARQ